MPQASVGVDLVSIERMECACRSAHFRERVFSAAERKYCDATARPAAHYAARFAAREAVLKALGCGWQGMSFTSVEVELDKQGRPHVILDERASRVLEEQGYAKIALSLSHTSQLAVASAVAMPPYQAARDAISAQDLSFRQARSIVKELE